MCENIISSSDSKKEILDNFLMTSFYISVFGKDINLLTLAMVNGRGRL